MTLKQRTYSAGRWTAASALFRAGMQILQVVILARLLEPADFGLMAVTVTILAVLGIFTDLGLSRSIIHFEDISSDAQSSLYWLNLLMGVALSLLLAACAPLLSAIFQITALTKVLVSASPFFLLSSIGQQFCALAEKELRFQALAINEIAAAALGFVAAIAIALADGGVYALVGAILVNSAANSLLAWLRLSSGNRPSLHMRLGDVKIFVGFGTYLISGTLVNTLVRQLDIFVAGLIVSPSALGIYSVPRDLSLRVGLAINPIITRVGFPIMSRLQSDKAYLRRIYLHTLRMTAAVNFPIYIFMAVFADEIVRLLYGNHWIGAGIYLRILAIWGLIRSTGNPAGALLNAVGAVKRALIWSIVVLLSLIPLYWIGIDLGGLMGFSVALVGIQIGLIWPTWYFLVRPFCGATALEYASQLFTPLVLALTAGAVSWLSTRGIPHGTLRLLLGATTGLVIYLGLSIRFNRQWALAMFDLIKAKPVIWK